MGTVYRYGVWFMKGLREYTFSGYQAAAQSFESLDGISCRGKSYMITGANSGIGKDTALALAKKGAIIHMVCRNKERGEEARQEIRNSSGNENIYLHLLDMSNPQKVFQFANEFKTSGKPLNVLINNAGCMVNTRQLNEYNLDVNFATNTIGPYILTETLLDLLNQQDHGQVITVTSGGMLLVKLDSDDIQNEKMSPYDGSMVYSYNKRQQVVMTEYWAKTHPKIHFSTMHPGWADTPAVKNAMPSFYQSMKTRLRTPQQGADTIVWLCLSPDAFKQKSGSFFQDREAVSKHLPLAWTNHSQEQEHVFIRKLEQISHDILGSSFNNPV